ncbi:hypothetical protein MRX96_011731 [Rhipicephalus microplus]
MDDNVEKSYTAAYFGYVMVFRLIGPVLGFALAFLTLKYPEDPTQTTSLKPGDPRWIGAWWFRVYLHRLGNLDGHDSHVPFSK